MIYNVNINWVCCVQLKRRIDENGKFVAEQLNKQLRAEARYRAEKKAVGALNNDLLHLEGQLLFLDGRYTSVLLMESHIDENNDKFRWKKRTF